MPMQNTNFLSSAVSMVSQPLKYHNLIWQLAQREVIGRYRGSVMGLLWSFLNPIFMLTVYTFFFSIVYKARWGTTNGSKFDFAVTLFAGLIPFSLFSECVNRAPHLIINNVNYVKKVIFPLEILSWVNLGSALFHAAVSLIVLLLFFFGIHHFIHWTAVFLPIVNLPLILLILGLSWFLSSVGVFIRDATHTVTMFTTALMFLSPVFYSVASIPEGYRKFIEMNPLTSIIEQNRAVLIDGIMPNWYSFGVSMVIGLVVAWLGYYWFEKTRPAFADVV